MAAILITDCTVTTMDVGGFKLVKIVTPATADDGDTIDVSTYFETLCFGICSGASDFTLLCTATAMGTSLTIPGATDNEARTIYAFGQ